MEITGTIILQLGIQSGMSNTGREWTKSALVIETLDPQYPKKVMLEASGKHAAPFSQLPVGAVFKFQIEINSREYNERWYTSITANKWEVNMGDAALPSAHSNIPSSPMSQGYPQQTQGGFAGQYPAPPQNIGWR